ncbi:sensor histidine kinase [Bosea caraganae]|nr:HWE histidine kinase domain-containing protein [Bosea caraganae]
MVDETWPIGGGETGLLLRGFNPSSSALGAPSGWPAALKAVVQLMLSSPTPMTLLWGRQGFMVYNDAYAVIAGARHPEILGQSVFEAWPEVVDFHRVVMDAVLGAGEQLSYRDLPLVLHRNGRAEDVWLNVDYSPILDEAGKPCGVLAIVFETTEAMRTKLAQEAAEQALRARERELAQVQKIGRVGGLEVDLRGGFNNKRSPEYLMLHGLPPEAVNESHEDWVRRIHPQDRAVTEGHFREAVAGTVHDYHAEYRIIRPSDGAMRWIAATAQIERDEAGRAVRLIGAHIDVTERKEAEAQQRLLLQELAHRVKNSLAMIQAIASQTFRNAGSIEAASETFSARLAALSRAHDLLVNGNWANATLRDVVGSVVGIQGEPERFAISGPDIQVGPKAALALTLILHELGTNAVKYGALSNQHGRVAVSWRIDDMEGERQLRLRWQESGGPPVEPPKRRGFGSRLIERTFPSTRCRVENTFPPAGVVFTLDAPLEALQDGDSGDEGK